MFSLGSSTTGERSYVIFDVGADSVAVGVGVAGPEGKQVLWHKRLEYAYQEATDYVRYERAMYATLLEVGMSLMSEGFRIAQHNKKFDAHRLQVMCILASPWFLATVGSDVRKAEKPFEVTQTIFDEMRSNMFSAFMATAESKSWKEVMGTPQLIEQFETEVRFNGYPVNTYLHRMTNELSTRSYLAVVSESVSTQVGDIIHRVLPNQNLIVTTSTHVLAGSIASVSGRETKRMTLLELGGQITGAALFTRNVLVGVSTIPNGTHHLLKKVAPKAASVKEARTVVDILLEKIKADDTAGTNLPEELSAPLSEWNEAVVQTARDLSTGIVPPRTIALMAKENWYPLYAAALIPNQDTVKTRSNREMQVVPYASPQEENKKTPIRGPQDNRLQALLQAVDESATANI